MVWLRVGERWNLRSDDGDGKASRVQTTGGSQADRIGDLTTLAVAVETLLCARGTVSERSVDKTRAAVRTITGEDSNGDHGATAEDIEEHAEQGEDGLAAEEACQEHGEDGVEDNGA